MTAIDTHVDTPSRRGSAILTLALLALAAGGWPVRASAQTAPQAQNPLDLRETPQPAVQAGAVPPLAIEQPVHDFGTLVKGDEVSHTFVLRNTGEEPVNVVFVKPSCGCTVAEFDKVIPPGGEGEVTVALDTMMITGKTSSGLEVFAEGSETAMATLELRAEVVPKLLAHPGYARWIYVQHEEEGTIVNTVYSNDGAEFEILSVETPAPSLVASFRPAAPEERREKVTGSQWLVDATLESSAPVGAITGYLVIHTTHPLQKVMEIPLSGFVRPTLFVDPQRGDFGNLKIRAPKRAVYRVRNFATEPIAVTGAATDVPGISAKVEPVEEGRRYNVVLELDPAAMAEGPFSGELRLKTDSEKVPTVTVDLSGTLIRPSDETSG
jgi:hypothetical protein